MEEKKKATKTKRGHYSTLSQFNIRDLGVSSYPSVEFVAKHNQ